MDCEAAEHKRIVTTFRPSTMTTTATTQQRPKKLIYGLIDPRTLLIRYVGKSSSGMTRPCNHGKGHTLRHDRTRCGNWIRKLQSAGLEYSVVILELCDSPEALALAERWWIAFGRVCGWPLVNHTDGGEGCPGRLTSAETKAKLRRTSTSMWKRPGFRERRLGVDYRDRETRERTARAVSEWFAKQRGGPPLTKEKLKLAKRNYDQQRYPVIRKAAIIRAHKRRQRGECKDLMLSGKTHARLSAFAKNTHQRASALLDQILAAFLEHVQPSASDEHDHKKAP